ncbi:dTDP-glucose 4,6-dehydratase [Phototrophicus methaneseepsis]|uniref:dTDP-glucose 4,6-dehydratase n=1 Tax=Phototrophicus methaneseepsis TaxID=2710758 RepID=A0A7S8EE51_9CHLR|nr:dTDP-glucose 4,6-dehydratase [Phototrophicus methaneseepsis]QPC85043.1 dTDP-glucose 4,6-dehydratase [Phototrophicus methaneseepsis]
MKNILVTGGAGFIGSAFVRHMVNTYPEYNIITFDKLTYAGNMDNLLPVKSASNHHFVKGDIADREAVRGAFEEYSVDTVVNFAAESHVDRSILDPNAFIMTDVVGVYALLEEARLIGVERFLQVSTDEVYGDIEGDHFSLESDHFLPNSPYAASKAGGELMVRSYHITYGMNTVVTRGSNTYGPYQYPEKLIPFFITEALDDRPLPVYGDGKQMRDWLHVNDHARGIDMVLHKGEAGEAYNIAGEDLRHNIDVVHKMLELLNKPESLIKYVRDREGHDRRYAMNAEKARQLGWERQHTFDTGLQETINWYLENEWWWRKIKSGDFLEYYKRQYADRIATASED